MMARPNETMRLEKALEILPFLQKGCLSFEEIAQMMGCPIEDAVLVMRDLAACEVDGEPLGFHFVDAEQARSALERVAGTGAQALEKLASNGGIIVSGNFDALASAPALKPDEAQALIAALDRMHVGGESPLRSKIHAQTTAIDGLDGESLLAFISTADASTTMAELAILCDQHRLADIEYKGTIRTIAPLELFRESNGETYLWAHNRDADRYLTYRIDRITHVEPRAEHAPADIRSTRGHAPLLTEHVEHALLDMPSDEEVDARIWMGAEVVREGDGRKLVRIPIQDDREWIARQVAARFGSIRVVEPATLATDVRACAGELLEELRARQHGHGNSQGAAYNADTRIERSI